MYRNLMGRPWPIYIAVSVGAYFISFLTLLVLNAGVNLLGVQLGENSPNGIQIFAIWSLVGMITAAFVGYRLDSRRDWPETVVYRTLFTIGGIFLQGVTTSATIYFCFMHVVNRGSLDFRLLEQPAMAKLCVYLVSVAKVHLLSRECEVEHKVTLCQA